LQCSENDEWFLFCFRNDGEGPRPKRSYQLPEVSPSLPLLEPMDEAADVESEDEELDEDNNVDGVQFEFQEDNYD